MRPRVLPRYAEVGLMQSFDGPAADTLSAEQLLEAPAG